MADIGYNNAKTFNEGIRVAFDVSDSGDVMRNRFVKFDPDGSTDSGKPARPIELAGSGDLNKDVVGIVYSGAGRRSSHKGTTDDPFTEGDRVTVVTAGTELVEVEQTDDSESDYIQYGDSIIIGSDGKAAKWTEPSDIGDTSAEDVSDEIKTYVDSYNQIVGKAYSDPDDRDLVAVKIKDD